MRLGGILVEGTRAKRTIVLICNMKSQGIQSFFGAKIGNLWEHLGTGVPSSLGRAEDRSVTDALPVQSGT